MAKGTWIHRFEASLQPEIKAVTLPIRIGINGFGRIGRTVARLVLDDSRLALVNINDIADDVENLVYLYNYDSTHGSPRLAARSTGNNTISFGGREPCKVFSEQSIEAVDWEDIDVLIDASGVYDNIKRSRNIIKRGSCSKVLLTNAPVSRDVDLHMIYGVNQQSYEPSIHHVIACNICDANALALPLFWIAEHFGISQGFITTLHPWLSYQNLVDSPIASQSNPGHFWKDYSLGRSSINTLIPKNTTACDALSLVMPKISSKLEAVSFRTPTSIVSSADITLLLEAEFSTEGIQEFLLAKSESGPHQVIRCNSEPLVGIDYIGSSSSAIIDLQWIKKKDKLLKLILWYDNEWGYSSRVKDAALMVGGNCK